MKNKKLFELTVLQLFKNIDEQSFYLIEGNSDEYEQRRLNILSLIDNLLSHLNEEAGYKQTIMIFNS